MSQFMPAPYLLSRLKRRASDRTWRAALELVESGRIEWRWRASLEEVVADGEVPTTNRNPFQVRVVWNGAALLTRCTCPVRRGVSCSHRLALGMLLQRAMLGEAMLLTIAPRTAPPGFPAIAPVPAVVPSPPPVAPSSPASVSSSASAVSGGAAPAAPTGQSPVHAPTRPAVPPQPPYEFHFPKRRKKGSRLRTIPYPGVTHLALNVRPQPVLALRADRGRLVAQLEYLYGPDPIRVPASLVESVTFLGNGVRALKLTRDRPFENQVVALLKEQGMSPARGGVFTAMGESLGAFAAETLPMLERLGWRIEGRAALDALAAYPRELTVSLRVRNQIDWFSFEMSAVSGAVSIPVKAVLEAWRAGRKYLAMPKGGIGRVPGEWLEASSDLIDAVEALPAAEGGGVKVRPCQVPMLAALAETVPVRDIDPGFTAMQKRLAELRDAPPTPLPEGLQASLRPYQVAGYNWLQTLRSLDLGGILADDMGLGKTLQVLALLLAEKRARGRQSLVVVPTSVLENWAREAARFTPDLKVVLLYGRGRLEKPELKKADVAITTYALLRRDTGYHERRSYHYVVLDEAQVIKNPLSDTAKACRRLKARHRLAMTGTPIENRLSELWSQFAFAMPELLGTERKFNARYVVPIEREGRRERQLELQRRVAPFILRRMKEDVARDLPALTEDVLFCDLAPDQAALYQSALKAMRSRVLQAVSTQGLDRSRFTVLEALLKLRQICCHPGISGLDAAGPVTGSAKLSLFQETLEEIVGSGHRALVFSQFVGMLKVLAELLERLGIPYLYLDGSTRERQALVDRFNSSDIPVFLISLKAGGAGLNLTGADYVIHYDPWWNPAVESQATDRAHRIGQTRPVMAYRLISRGTVEEKMLELHARKRALVEGLLAGDETLGRSLTEADLEYLFPAGEPLSAGEGEEEREDEEEVEPEEEERQEEERAPLP